MKRLIFFLSYLTLSSISLTFGAIKVIVIDPGHGGTATGAVGPYGLQEKTVNLLVASKLKYYFAFSGMQVEMTRESDVEVSLAKRVEKANNLIGETIGFDEICFLSIHHNGFTIPPETQGTETVYPLVKVEKDPSDTTGLALSDSKKLSEKVQNRLLERLGYKNRGLKNDTQTYVGSIYVLRHTKVAAELSEASSISGPDVTEAKKFIYDANYMENEAWSIYAGLCDHIGIVPIPPPSPTTGTINVTTNLSQATFKIEGSQETKYTGSGTSWTKENVPYGTYKITYNAVSGYHTPASEQKELSANGTITFNGVYVSNTEPSPEDITPPAGSIMINNNRDYTTTSQVTLTISIFDGVSQPSEIQMKLSNDGTNFTEWMTYSPSKVWSLVSSSDGEKYVYVKFKDKAGNESLIYSDSIILDTILPQISEVIPQNNATNLLTTQPIKVIFSEPIRNGQGRISISNTSLSGNNIFTTDALEYKHNGMQKGKVYNATVSNVQDLAGNTMSPANYNWTFEVGDLTLQVTSPSNELWTKESLATISGTSAVDAVINVNGVDKTTADGNGNFSTTYNLTEGKNTITIKAKKPGFEDATATRVVYKDTYLPKLTISTTKSGQNATIGVNAADTASGVVDVSGIKKLTVTAAGEPRTITSTGQSGSYPKSLYFAPVFILPGGENTVTVTAWDGLDNEKTENIPVTIEMPIGSTVTVTPPGGPPPDPRNPTVTIYSPNQQTFKIEGTGIPGTILTFRITIDGQSYEVTATVGPDGKWVVYVTLKPGQTAKVYIIKSETLADAPAPEGRVWRPGANGKIYLAEWWEILIANLSLAIKQVDPTFIQIITDYEPPAQSAEKYQFSNSIATNTISVSYNLTFSGNVSISIYDSSGNLVKNILEDEFKLADAYQFSWNGKNNGDIARPEGDYTYAVTAKDTTDSSNVYSESGKIIIDNTPPQTGISLVSINNLNNNLMNIWGTASDENLKNYTVGYRLSTSTGSFAIINQKKEAVSSGILETLDTAYLEDGEYTVRVRAEDYAANVSETTETITVTKTLSGLKIIVGDVNQVSQNLGATSVPTDNPAVFIDDAIPAGAVAIGSWTWSSSVKYSGAYSHYSSTTIGVSKHYFIHPTTPFTMKQDESIVQYVYIDPASPPEQILLQFYTDLGDGEHRVYWGNSKIQTGGVEGTPSLYRMGPVPTSGQWVRLKISPSTIGLAGKEIKGMLFATYNGRAYWDKTTSAPYYDTQTETTKTVDVSVGDDSTDTTIKYTLLKSATVQLDVYDFSGAFIRNIFSEFKSSGSYENTWDQKNTLGNFVSDGDYYFRFASTAPIDSESIVHLSTGDYTIGFSTIAYDVNGNKYEIEGNTITKRTQYGYLLTQFGSDNLSSPTGIAISTGDIYVQDTIGEHKFLVGARKIEIKNIVANIRIPAEGSLVRATVPIFGVATAKNFKDYKVEYGKGFNPSTWTAIVVSQTEVLDNYVIPSGQQTIYGNLATWETGMVPGEEYPLNDIFHPAVDLGISGKYTVRLTVDSYTGQTKSQDVHLIVGRVINNGTGGIIASDDGKVKVTVPPLALQNDWDLFAIVGQDTGTPDLPSGYNLIGNIYDFKPADYTFLRPCILEFAYTPSDLGAGNEDRLGLYRYEPVEKKWVLVSTRRDVILSEGDLVASLLIDDNFTEFSKYKCYYAILEDTTKPQPPVIYQPPSPTNQKQITVSGKTESSSVVDIFVNDSSTYTTTANTLGDFVLRNVLLSTGTNSLYGVATDVSGYSSDASSSVTVNVLLSEPTDVYKISFKQSNFIIDETTNLNQGEKVYIELTGLDASTSTVDSAYCVLFSSYSDPVGIKLQLTETGINTGIYRGSALTGSETDQQNIVLAAGIQGEQVKVVSETDQSKYDILYIEDLTASPPPDVWSTSHLSAVQNTFETGLGEFSKLSDIGADVVITTETKSTGDYSVRIKQIVSKGDFSAKLKSSGFDAKQYPIISFDYKIPSGVKTNIFVIRGGVWNEITFTDTAKNLPPTYTTIGSVSPVADNNWRSMEFNLYNMLKQKYPNDTEFVVDSIVTGDWDSGLFWSVTPGNNAVGSTMYVDNFSVKTPGSNNPNPVFEWSSAVDASGIAGYSYVLDQSSNTVPDEISEGAQTSTMFINKAEGVWYFHVRSVDGAGNWSTTNHCAIKIDTQGPSVSSPYPENGVRASANEVRLDITDSGGSGVNPETIKVSINGTVYDYSSGGISYNTQTGTMTFRFADVKPSPVVIPDGGVVNVTLTEAKDFVGNDISSAYSWWWIADYSRFSGSDVSLLTINGAEQPCWSRDSSKIAFVSERDGNKDIWTMDSSNYAELISTGMYKVTSSTFAETEPAFSHDGAKIAYSKEGDIWLINSDGSNPVQLSSGTETDSHPVWSSDSTKIVFSRSSTGLANLWQINMNPADWTKISETQLTADDIGYNLEPQFSFDDAKITYRRSLYVDNVWVMNSDGTEKRQLTTSNYDFAPSFSYKNDRVIFDTKRAGGISSVWISDITGENQKLLIDNHATWPETDPVWSPDGSRIAFTSTRNGSKNVWVMSLLEVTDVATSTAIFSPNGDGICDTADIKYNLSVGETTVNIEIYDFANVLVRTLLSSELQSTGNKAIPWDGKNNSGIVCGDGVYTYKIIAMGKSATEPVIKQGTVKLDNSAPATTLHATEPLLNTVLSSGSTYYVKAQTVFSLAATDGSGIGLDYTYYSWDKGATWTTYSDGNFTLQVSSGYATVQYKSVDKLINYEQSKEVFLFVDNKPPITDIVVGGTTYYNEGERYITPQTYFVLSSTDDITSVVSGIKEIKYTADGINYTYSGGSITFTTGGAHTFSYYATDNVGNNETSHQYNVFVDTVPPAVSLFFDPPPFFNGISSYTTTSTTCTFSANDAESGASGIYYKIDGSEFTEYTTGFMILTEDVHTIYYKAEDNLGNESIVKSFSFITDDSAPTVQIQPDGLIYVYGATNYAPISTKYILSSSTEVTQIEYSINGSSFVVCTDSITLTDAGLNTIDFKALKDEIYEDTVTYRVVVDMSAPQTVSSILGWQYSGSSLFIGATSQIKLEASETGELPSGLKTTGYTIDDGTAAAVYVSPFNLSSTGEHSVKYWSTDNVENTESTNTLTIVLDNVPPSSQIAYSTECGKSYISSGKTYLSGDVYFSVSSTETVSGLKRIEYAIDSANYTTYTGTFNITADGWHTIYYRGVDNVENKEPAKSYAIVTDKTPPAVTVTLQGNSFSNGATNYANSDTRFVFVAPDNLSGTNRIEVSVDSGTYNSIVGYITLSAEGPHTFAYKSVDNLDNWTDPPLVHNVTIDNTAPSTDFFVSGSSYTTGQTVYISSGSLIGFNVTDTVSGVKETKYKIDSGYWTSYSTGTGISITAGFLHTITYYSTDSLLNREPDKQKNVYLDATPPSTVLTTSEQPFDNGVNLFMSDTSSITLTASDTGCGVSKKYYAVDSSSFTEYTEPFMISTAGFHNVYYYAVDHLNNSEQTRLFEIVIDSTPPSAKITPSVDLYVSNGVNYASSTVTYSLSSLNTTSFMVNVDSAGYVAYTDSITFATEGLHTIAFYGIVNGINEDESVFDVYVDIGKPAISLAFSGPQYSAGNKVYTSSSTLYLLTAEDSETMVNTGIKYAEYGIDTSGWLMITSLPVYQKQLNIFPTEGEHVVRYRTSDNVGNITESSTTISVDKTPPVIALLPDGSPYIANGKNYVSGNMKFSIIGTDAGSGVNSIECKIDTGSYIVYQNTFTVNIAGDHIIYYRASDNIGNATEVKSYSIFVDTISPSESIAVTGKSYTNSQGINFALPGTQFSFSGADNIAFDRAEYNPDDDGYMAYSTPVTFISEGLHNLRYKSADKVGNWSDEKTYSVTIDTTPPGTTADILDFSMIEDGQTYVGPQTRYVFLSTDTASGVYITNYKIDEGSWNPLTENSVMLDLASGEHLISYYSVDRLENSEPAKSFTVYVDTIPPSAPQGLTVLMVNDTSAKLNWTANAEPDLAGYNIYRDGIKVSTYIVTLTTYTDSGLTPEEYGWQISAVDKLGNESVVTSTVSIVVGKLPCIVSLALPEKYSLVTGTVTITGAATGLHFSQYELEYGQGPEPASWTNITTSTNPVESGPLAQWNTIAVSDGLYTVKLKAKNTADVYTETGTIVSIDNTLPTVNISLPVANFYVRQTVEIKGTAYDVNFSSYKVEYSAGAEFILISESTNTVSDNTLALWDTSQLSDGVYTIKLTAIDKVFLSSQTTISINVDNSTPTASITSPSENQEIFGTITIDGTASANNFKEYILEYGKGSTPSVWTTITASTNSVSSGALGTLDTVGLKGIYALRLRVTNLADGESVSTVSVNIKPQLIITELNPQDAYHDWAEIYCTTGTVDISGYVLSNLNAGTHSQLATSSVTITQGQYAIVHWKDGADETDSTGDTNSNGYIDLFIPDLPLSSADDQLVLMKDNKIVDAVIWTNNDGSMASDEVDNANYITSQNEWTGTFSQSNQLSAALTGNEEQSLGRSSSTATDTDSKNDWSVIQTPNPGKDNSISVPNIVHTPVTVSTAGTNIEITAEITDTDGISSATLYYKNTSSETFSQVTMSASSNTYTATIPSDSVTTAGVDYYIKAIDNLSGNSYNPLFAPLSIYYVSVNPAPSSAKIIVNEIMYDPSTPEPDTEWIEIYNAGETAVDISSWTVADTTTTTGSYEGIYTLSTGTVLAAHQYLVLARSTEAANGNYDLIYGGNSQGNIALINTGDQVFVRDNNGFIIDSVDYVSSWGGSNGTGPNNNSLERKNPLGTTQDSANWASSSVSSGTPKAVNSVTIKPVISNVSVAPSVFSPNGDELFDSTTVYYSVSQDVSVTIKVYDSGDTLVKTLFDGVFKSSGTHNEIWDGKNAGGYYVATGTYTIKIDAVNSGAITANTVSVNTQVDNTLPNAEISSPQYNQIYGHMVTISGTATDNNFSGYTIKFGTGSATYEWSTVLTATNSVINSQLGIWDTGNLNGTYTVRLDVKDAVENVKSSTVTVKIDNTAPVTTITPIPALYNQYASSWTKYGLSAYDPAVSDVSAGVLLTEYKIDSGNFTTYTTSITITTGGNRTITYRSKDVVNNTETDKTFNVYVDTISPVTTATVYGDYYNDGVNNYGTYASSVVFTSSDTLSGAKETWVSVDNGSWGLYASPVKFTTEGTHSVKYYSKDNVGNTEKIRTYLITVDDTFPIVNISNPLSGSYIRQTVEIKGVIVDPNLKQYYIEVGQGNNPTSWTRIYTSGLTDINTATYNQLIAIYGVGVDIAQKIIDNRPFHNWQEIMDVLWIGQVRLREIQDNTLLAISQDGLILFWNTTQQPDGVYTLRIIAEDKVGHFEEERVTNITIDNTIPASYITAPSSGSYIQGNVQIAGTAKDINFSYYKLSQGKGANPSSWNLLLQSQIPVDNKTFTYWNSTQSDDGPRSFRLQVYDKAGNDVDYRMTAYLDNVLPVVIISTPAANQTVKGLVTVSGTATDMYFDHYALRVNSVDVYSSTVSVTNGFLGSWNTTGYADGQYDLYLVAQDTIGHSNNTYVRLNVDNPPVISGVSVTDVQSRQATAGWLTNEPADTKVEYGTSTAYGFSEYNAGFVTSHSVVLNNLLPGTTYHYCVKSKDSLNQETQSYDYTFTTLMEATSVQLSVDSVGDNTVSLSWTEAQPGSYPVDYYKIYRSTFMGEITAKVFIASTTQLSYTNAGLVNLTTYYYQIVVKDTGGFESESSNEVAGMPQDTVAPGNITNLLAENVQSIGDIVLSWTAPGDNNYSGILTTGAYRIDYATYSKTWNYSDYELEVSTYNVNSGSNQSYVITGLSGNTTYYFCMWTADEVPNWSSDSNIAILNTPAFAPSALPLSNVSTYSVTANWGSNGNPPGTEYTAECSSVSAGGTVLYSQTTVNTNYEFAGLSLNTTYYFRVKAISYSGISTSWTDLSSTSTLANVPEDITVNNRTTSGISISWGINSNPQWTTYILESSNNGTNWNIEISTTSTSYTDNGLNENASYWYRVKAVNNNNAATAYSSVLSTMTLAIAPSAITDLLSYTGPYSGEAVLIWTAPGDDGTAGTATSYDIRYRLNSPITNDSDFNSASQVTGEPTPSVSGSYQWMTVAGLTPNNTYYFAIKTADEAGLVSGISNSPSAYLYYEGSPIQINEIVAACPPSEGSDAIEFYVKRYGSYSNYKLYEMANMIGTELTETFPTTGDWSKPIPAGTYIVLHLMSGTDETEIGPDNIIHIYSTESGGQVGLIKTDNVLLLSNLSGITFANGVYQSGTIVDAVALANQDTVNFAGESGNQFEQFSAAINAAVNQGQWNKEHTAIVQIDAPNSRALTSTKSLARTQGASDTSPSKSEWSIRDTITLGSANGSSTALPGRGTATISSSTVIAGSTTSFTITYTSEVNDLDDAGHMVVITIPNNWTQPQTTSSNTAGYVTTNYSIESGWALSVSSHEIIVPVGNMVSGGTISLDYKNAIVQTSSGTATFTVKADDRGTNIGELTSGSPQVNIVFIPEKITNMSAATGNNTGEVTLNWTAPDPRDGTNTADYYDIRYTSYVSISSEEIFTSAIQITNEPAPQTTGTGQSLIVTGLVEGNTYYFAMKSSNDYGVWSEISNSPSASAQVDTFAPNGITDLKAARGYQQGEVNLSWTAPGDDGTVGTASAYIIRYSTMGSIDSGNWLSATDITGEPTPSVSGTQQNMAVTGLTPGGIYYFAMKSQDDAENISTVSNCSSGTARPSNIADYLVISEICVGTTGSTPEYVELYNPTTYPITLQGNVKLKMTTGTSDALQNKTITWLNSTIPTHGFFLFASTDTIGAVSADAKYSAGLTGTDGVMLTDASDVVIDKVAWGTSSTGDIPTCTENTRVSSTTNLSTGDSIERKANIDSTASSMLPGGADHLSGNGFDTENNNNDFVVHIGTYNPQNSGFCEGSPAFWARLDPTEITIQPGQHKEIEIVITNFDDEDCFFDLSLNTALLSKYYAMSKTVKVKAGDTNSAKINIHIPASVSLPEDTMYPVTVQVKHLCKPSHHERHNPENIYMVWINGEVLIKGDTNERTRTVRMVASTGGGIYNRKGAQVTVNNGTIPEDAEFQMIEENRKDASEETAKSNSKQEQGLIEVGAGFEFEPSSVKFSKDMVITLPYDTVLSSQSYTYYVCSWDKAEKNWKMLPTVEIDEGSKQVSCKTEHFSLYKVFAKPIRLQATLSSRVEADPAFKKGEIYSFPNPAKRGKHPTLHIECGIADKVEIRIYNIAAELVDSTELYGVPPVINGKYAYEYNWDISDIASGVYIYTIRAKKSGYSDIKATGKAAIIK